jgi:hypothetical protein
MDILISGFITVLVTYGLYFLTDWGACQWLMSSQLDAFCNVGESLRILAFYVAIGAFLAVRAGLHLVRDRSKKLAILPPLLTSAVITFAFCENLDPFQRFSTGQELVAILLVFAIFFAGGLTTALNRSNE